ncbi:MAG TPA: DUF3048 domain-containing protein [Candidatus Saccharimonadales bacterium]|nr:DUF3048 domain-containing protein [Candidatus Saccharimonadales bacterium]
MVNDFLPNPRNRGSYNARNPQRHVPPQQHPNAFRTPETVAADDEIRLPNTATASPLIGGPGRRPKRSFKDKLRSLSKKQWAIIAAVAVVVLGGLGGGAYALLSDSEPPKKSVAKQEATPEAAPQPTTVPSKLTGLPVAPENNLRHVTAVMIENSMDARPQSGLNNAGVLFEAVAEGGITRFLTLFQDDEPEYVGPVRSVRPYYIQWAQGFDAGIAHVGGSGEALAMIRDGRGKDLDQFFDPAAYWRVGNRFAPHNMYTSIPKLNDVENRKGWKTSNYTGFARKAKENPSSTPAARVIDFNISGAIYNSHYEYDAASNSYKRSEGGKPHTDEKSGAQLSPKVVIGLVIPQGRNGIYTTYQTIGSGEAVIFQDGAAIPATWSKSSPNSNFTFKDASGADVPLNPGQTWLSVVGSRDRITYAP